jgi:uncharacterized protein involved in exopolysaccharide biosynthesis
MIVFVTAGVLVAGFVWFMQLKANAVPAPDPPVEVHALLVFTREGSPFPQDGQAAPRETESEFDRRLRTQAALIKSRPVLLIALRRNEVAGLSIVRNRPNPVEWLEQTLQVDRPNDTDLFRVSLTGEKPEEQAVLVNAVVDAYKEEVVKADRNRGLSRLDEIEKIYSASAEKLFVKRDMLKRLAETLKVPKAKASSIRLAQQRLLDCSRELRRVELEKSAAETRLARKQANKNQVVLPAVIAELEDQLAVLKSQAAALVVEEDELKKEIENLSRVTFELEMKERELDVAEKMLMRLRQERERLGIEIQLSKNRVRIVNRAEAAKGK